MTFLSLHGSTKVSRPLLVTHGKSCTSDPENLLSIRRPTHYPCGSINVELVCQWREIDPRARTCTMFDQMFRVPPLSL